MKRRDFLRVSPLSLAALMRAAEARDYEFLANELGIARVTDPGKRVTDTVVLRHLAKQGIDKDYVEFDDDYEKRPYSKGYRDIITGRRILVSSGLPMRRLDDGSKIIPRFERSGSKFYIGNNLFEGVVEGNRIALVANNDQPNGMRKGDELVWQSRLFIGGVERKPLTYTPTLLEADPVNANYSYNVLEWDYGVCKRRLRVIEGRLRSWWVFDTRPGGDIVLVHNKHGKGILKLGTAYDATHRPISVAVNGDVETVFSFTFSAVILPLTIGDSATFYPDADPETNTVDGTVWRQAPSPPESWGTIRGQSGTNSQDNYSYAYWLWGWDDYNSGYEKLYRSVFLFDTSIIGSNSVIDAATFYIYRTSRSYSSGIDEKTGLYKASTRYNTELDPSHDYTRIYSTYECGVTSWTGTDAYASISFASYALDYINKTGISKFGVRNAYHDADNHTPPTPKYIGYRCYFSEKGSGYKPKLTVMYTPPPPSPDIARALMRSGGPVPLVSNGKANRLLYHGR